MDGVMRKEWGGRDSRRHISWRSSSPGFTRIMTIFVIFLRNIRIELMYCYFGCIDTDIRMTFFMISEEKLRVFGYIGNTAAV